MKTILLLLFIVARVATAGEIVTINGLVQQVLEHGVLVRVAPDFSPRGNSLGMGGYTSTSTVGELKPGTYFVIDLPKFKTLVDDDAVQAKLREIGIYRRDGFTFRAFSAKLK